MAWDEPGRLIRPKQQVVVYPVRADRPDDPLLLMGIKQRKHVAGSLVGPGGGVESGETSIEAAQRELCEETALLVEPKHLRLVAKVAVDFPNSDVVPVMLHVYFAHETRGKIRSNGELRGLRWHRYSRLEMALLPPTDRIWLPRVICYPEQVWYYRFEMTGDFKHAQMLTEDKLS